MKIRHHIYTLLLLLFAPFVSIAGHFIYNSNDGESDSKSNTELYLKKEINIVTFKELLPLLQLENDTVYVVNFWATWCGPCIKEIPYFEQLGNKYSDKNLKVIMISMDMPDQIESKLIPFIYKHKMKNEVILLDDPDFNSWIPIVDKNWTGAIPATLVYSEGFREFYPKVLTFTELEGIVKPLLSE